MMEIRNNKIRAVVDKLEKDEKLRLEKLKKLENKETVLKNVTEETSRN